MGIELDSIVDPIYKIYSLSMFKDSALLSLTIPEFSLQRAACEPRIR